MDTIALQRAATDAIIEAFGGLSGMARHLGHKNPTTVQGWKARGVIPARQQPLVLAAAERLGMQRPDFYAPPHVAAA